MNHRAKFIKLTVVLAISACVMAGLILYVQNRNNAMSQGSVLPPEQRHIISLEQLSIRRCEAAAYSKELSAIVVAGATPSPLASGIWKIKNGRSIDYGKNMQAFFAGTIAESLEYGRYGSWSIYFSANRKPTLLATGRDATFIVCSLEGDEWKETGMWSSDSRDMLLLEPKLIRGKDSSLHVVCLFRNRQTLEMVDIAAAHSQKRLSETPEEDEYAEPRELEMPWDDRLGQQDYRLRRIVQIPNGDGSDDFLVLAANEAKDKTEMEVAIYKAELSWRSPAIIGKWAVPGSIGFDKGIAFSRMSKEFFTIGLESIEERKGAICGWRFRLGSPENEVKKVVLPSRMQRTADHIPVYNAEGESFVIWSHWGVRKPPSDIHIERLEGEAWEECESLVVPIGRPVITVVDEAEGIPYVLVEQPGPIL